MKLAMILVLLVIGVPCVRAQEIHVGWGDATGGGENLGNPCDPTAQVNELVGAFRMPPGLSAVYTLEATVDFCTLPLALPPWWGGAGSEGCIPAVVYPSADFTNGPSTAVDYWGGRATATVTYEVDFLDNPVRGRAIITVQMPPGEALPVVPNTLYYGFKLVVDGRAATCGGCEIATCFMTNGITLRGPEGEVRFYGPYDSAWAGWRYFTLGCPFVVPVSRTSFGALKASFD